MLELKELRIRGVGRFVEEQIINFETLGSMVQVDGQNNNTRGSSGAGKSTIFQALEYLLGINKTPSTVLKSRYTDDAMYVQGKFLHDGKPLTITRHKKLHIDYHDGAPVTGSSALSEEKLESIISIPRDLFRPMMHKRQKEGGFFLSMTPSQMNNFLMNCLGLGHFKAKLEILDKKIKEHTEELTLSQNSLYSGKSALKATEDAIISLGLPPIREMHQPVVLELKSKAEKSAAELSVWLTAQKIDLETLEAKRPQIVSIPFDRTTLDYLESKYSDLEKSINQLKNQERDRVAQANLEASQIRNQITKCQNTVALGAISLKDAEQVAEQIKQMKVGKCYVCNQDWQNLEKQASLIKSIGPLREKISAGKLAESELPGLNTRLNEAVGNIVPKDNTELTALADLLNNAELSRNKEREKEKQHQVIEMTRNREEQTKFASIQSSLREKHDCESQQLRGQADVDRRAFDASVAKLQAYEEARSRYETSMSSLSQRSTSYGKAMADAEGAIRLAEGKLALAEELKRGIKSYLSCSFDDALETIGENSTALIRHIPNMANATIQLHGTKETQDGKIKEEVNAVIHMDGEENIDIRSLCGGERTATDLAIDLSVIDLIETRANKGIDIFILDEPFDGLDTVCIEMALEVLKNSNVSKRLIIVDHNPEVKQMVESRLTVVRDGATSKIVQAT